MILGALLGAALLTSSGFRVASEEGRSWLVNPTGQKFVSIGVCCVDTGRNKDEPLNPGYTSAKYYDSPEAWAAETKRRLREWRFNTVGAWSEHAALSGDLYQTPVLHLGASGAPWTDMADPKVRQGLDDIARDGIARFGQAANVIGYFSDNELGWWYGAMWEWAFKAEAESESRKEIVDLLRERYETWSDLEGDFDPEGATSWDELAQAGRLFLRPGGEGMGAVRAYMGLRARRYYALCKAAIARYAPNALFLGDRYISSAYPEVVRAAGEFVDVLSTNYNAIDSRGELDGWYLDELHRLSGKPVMITEFYASAMENRSGNMNDSSGFPTVATQAQRAKAAANQLRAFLAKPYVVGAHWFQYYDEPRHGRDDGENYNMGLVDIENRPYERLIRELAGVRPLEVHQQAAPPPANSPGLPYVPARNASEPQKWDLDRAFVPPLSGEVRGELRLAWTDSGLLALVRWDEDRFFEAFYRSGQVPPEDRARFELRIGRATVRAVGGPDGEPSVEGGVLLRSEKGVRNSLLIRVPSNTFGFAKLDAGQRLAISARLWTRARGYRMRWAFPSELKLSP